MRITNKIFATALLMILFALTVDAQNKVLVKGTVLDATTNTPLANVTIASTPEGQNLGVTDSLGKFSLQVTLGQTLLFTSVNYEPGTLNVTRSGDFNVPLKGNAKAMDAVVVQGFTNKVKETVTGSTVRLKGDVVQGVPVSDFSQLLQGQVSGMNVQVTSGAPGATSSINIGGVGTVGVSSDGYLTPTSPLFVIDGVPVDMNTDFAYGFQTGAANVNPLSLIPPDDIEYIDVLKDAAAISQYGSRGTYGVILVTTKRGRSQVPIVSYSGDVYLRVPPSLLKTIGGVDERYIRLNTILNFDTSNAEVSKAYANQFAFLTDSLNPYYNNSTNWQDYFYKPTINHSHNVQVRGGTEKFNYKTNLNYGNERGIIKGTDLKRYTIGMNAQYNPIPQFRLNTSVTASLATRGNGSGNGALQTGVASSAAASSLLPAPSRFSSNNLILAGDANDNMTKNNRINTNITLLVEPVKNLQLNNSFSYSYTTNNVTRYSPSWLSGNSSSYFNSTSRQYYFYNRSLLSYLMLFGKHTIYPYVFSELTSTGTRLDAQQFSRGANDQILGPLGWSINYNNWSQTKGGTRPLAEERVHAYGGSITYDFDKKYVITFDYRLDKTSTNGPSFGYKQSPTLSARWNFYKEKWFDNTILSNGALRGSYGTVIRPVGSIFDVYGTYAIGNYYNNNPTVNLQFNNIPNPNFEPESSTKARLGLELGFVNNRYSFVIEPFYNTIDNQLWGMQLSNITAFNQLTDNGASVVTQGVEFSTNLRVIETEKHRLTLDANLTYNKNTLAQLPGGIREDIVYQTDENGSTVPVVRRLGLAQFSNLMFVNKGVYASTSDVPVNPATGLRLQYGSRNIDQFFKAGDPIWVDINGDYIIDENDMVPVGNPLPLMYGGFTPMYQFGNFQLRVSTSFIIKRDILNLVLANRLNTYTNPTSLGALQPIDDLNYWKPVNGDLDNGTSGAVYPNPFDFTRADALNPYSVNQTLYMEDGSYFKIGSILLSYSFPEHAIRRFKMSQLRINASMYNVYTFSKYSGINPETVTQLGRDVSGGYPTPRGYSLGVSIQF
ncbi:MAG: SusC/RagA family TonB-linked outer membrane protein [Niabella sp.]